MIRALLSPQPLFYENGMMTLRILAGAMMAYHGVEVFDTPTMDNYATWDMIKNLPGARLMVYLGKGIELVTGICFVIGLFTRIAAVLMCIDMLYICFFVGHGRFYYEDQHPFLFALLALVFFFTGPVKLSVDGVLFKKVN
ncbi:MAG: DoxX family protein, partial [Chryseolinea sp.]